MKTGYSKAIIEVAQLAPTEDCVAKKGLLYAIVSRAQLAPTEEG